VKLSDRLHNMRTIEFHSKLQKRKQIAEETLLFFVPIAQHLGLKHVEEELQTRSSAVLEQVE
jgi:(p)ppGpp synthase/HD superfamily hydrolase